MSVIRYLFLDLTVTFFRAARRADTRLWYCVPGFAVFVAGWACVVTRQHPSLSLLLLVVGSTAMRVQGAMIEQRRRRSFRNAGIVLLGAAGLCAVVGAWVWLPVTAATALGLLGMQVLHDAQLVMRIDPTPGDTAHAVNLE